MSRATLVRIAVALAATALTFGPFGAAAGANPPEDVPRSDRAARDAAVTEDDDGNDGGTPNNVVDHGDDRHPSGKDRSVERGRSGNQGRSPSDPDDDGRGPDRSNGGADKPDGPGGVDLADQDANNGCGNDDDFEDDNEGLCLGRSGAPGQQRDGQTDAALGAEQDREPAPALPEGSPTVGGVAVDATPTERATSAPADVEVHGAEVTASAAAAPEVEVLGDTVTRRLGALGAADAAGSTLPRTGAGLLALGAFGLLAVAVGTLVARIGRSDATT